MSTNRDERTVATQQRWAARGLLILMIALAIDLLVRILILKQEPRQYLDISAIWIATMLYASIGITASGVAPFEGKWSAAWLLILIISAGNMVMSILMGQVHGLAELVASIVSAGAGAFMAILILRGVYGVWERRTLGRGPREG